MDVMTRIPERMFLILIFFAIIIHSYTHATNGWLLPSTTISNPVSAYNTAESSLSVAMDSTGNALATWVIQANLVSFLAIDHYNGSNQMWSSTIKRVSQAANVFTKPFLRMTSDGTAFIMWREGDAAPYYYTATKYPAHTVWETWNPETVQLSTTYTLAQAQLAINDLGDALFISGSSSGYKSNFYDHTNTWATDPLSEQSTSISIQASNLQLTLDNSGTGRAIFISSSDLFVTTYQSSAWDTPVQVNTIGTIVSDAKLYTDNIFGKSYIIWIEDGTKVRVVQIGQTPKTLATSSGTIGSIKAAMDIQGHITFMWTENGATSGSLLTTYFDGSYWNSWTPTITTLATSGSQPILYYTLGIQPQTPYTILAAWEVHNGSQFILQTNQAVAATWGTNQDIFLLGNNRAYDPLVGLDGTGNAAVSWGQVAPQLATSTVLINTLIYDATEGWQSEPTVLSNSGYCDCN
jgi:hypothetical protein